MVADTDTDTVRAKLNNRWTIARLDQMATAFGRNAESLHPLLKVHYAVLFAADAHEFAPLAKGIDGIGAQAGLHICKSHDLKFLRCFAIRLTSRYLFFAAAKDRFETSLPLARGITLFFPIFVFLIGPFGPVTIGIEVPDKTLSDTEGD